MRTTINEILMENFGSSCSHSKMKQQTKVVSEITTLTFWVFRFLGWNPLDDNPSFRAKFYFLIAITYAGLCFLQEATYFVQHIGGANSFLILTNVGPCTGFVALALVKVVMIYGNKGKLKRIVNRLESLCLESTLNIDVTGTIINSKKMMKTLTVFYFVLIWIFNLIPLVVIIFNVLYDGSYKKSMPYFMWYPWDCQQPIVFEICYAVVIWGAFTCAIGIISANLMFSMIVAFICLQFNVLRRRIRKIVQEKFKEELLRQWINDHNELMQIIHEVEEIFSPGILINFLGSVFILCMVGFQTFVSFNNFICSKLGHWRDFLKLKVNSRKFGILIE